MGNKIKFVSLCMAGLFVITSMVISICYAFSPRFKSNVDKHFVFNDQIESSNGGSNIGSDSSDISIELEKLQSDLDSEKVKVENLNSELSSANSRIEELEAEILNLESELDLVDEKLNDSTLSIEEQLKQIYQFILEN